MIGAIATLVQYILTAFLGPIVEIGANISIIILSVWAIRAIKIYISRHN